MHNITQYTTVYNIEIFRYEVSIEMKKEKPNQGPRIHQRSDDCPIYKNDSIYLLKGGPQ